MRKLTEEFSLSSFLKILVHVSFEYSLKWFQMHERLHAKLAGYSC